MVNDAFLFFNDAFYLFILWNVWNVLFYEMFYLMMRFILIYLRLYLFKALFNIQSFIFTPIPIISNNAYPFLSNSKISFTFQKL